MQPPLFPERHTDQFSCQDSKQNTKDFLLKSHRIVTGEDTSVVANNVVNSTMLSTVYTKETENQVNIVISLASAHAVFHLWDYCHQVKGLKRHEECQVFTYRDSLYERAEKL